MTDPRLVAALAAALHHYRGTCELWTISEAACPIDHRVDAAAMLPAFLADPRTHEWLEERLWDGSDRVDEFGPWIDQPTDAGKETREFAGAILGREP